MASRVKRAIGGAVFALGLSVGAVVAAPGAASAGVETELPTLKLGSTGTGVKCVEQMLWVIGAPEVIPDGIYGLQTQWRVKDFQRFFGLTVNGEVDATTGRDMFYIASLQGENPLRDPFDIWNAERAAYCENYVPH
jgi:peptidoglycan hydrolase-like protein with peptidoglycan-binding domain